MKKIAHLTAREEALLPVMREEWIKIGLATGPADRDAAQAAITDAYRMACLEPPRFWLWFGSPWAAHQVLVRAPFTGGEVSQEIAKLIADELQKPRYAQSYEKVVHRPQREVIEEIRKLVRRPVETKETPKNN